ncbi:alpha/beta hydrolase fold domain-containing protein [Fontibacillus sp. BL9]|uniref:alpha/beta hydrolase fold domain-containing protein n=1 Tax=Fontibacillus sp. BL9 TaxID=3389971 RepID=UPI00397D7741
MKMISETKVYKRTEQSSIYADIYYHGSQTPVIIYIHSGALIFGTRKWLPIEQVEIFKNAGFSIISIDYRLAPETNFQLIIEDVEDALNWVRSTASKMYDFNTDKIALIGSSAGAYLSLVSGTMEYRPNAIVSFYGYGDILGKWYSEPSEFYCKRPIVNLVEAEKYLSDSEVSEGSWERFNYYLWCRQHGTWVEKVTGFDRDIDSELLRKYNPIDNISKYFPPTLFLHGDKDTDVPYEQSLIMYEELRKVGIETDLITVNGADHVFDQNINDVQVRIAFEKTVGFLKKHLCE